VLARRAKWMYAKEPLEVVNGFTYVGVYFTCQLSMHKMAEAVSMKAKTALLILLNVLYQFKWLPFKTFCKHLTPRLLQYCYLALTTMLSIETVQMYACNRFLNVSKMSCNDAVIGDVGRCPIYIFAAKQCIKYW